MEEEGVEEQFVCPIVDERWEVVSIDAFLDAHELVSKTQEKCQ